MIFLLDENFNEKVIPLLAAYFTQDSLITVAREFGKGSADTEWIPRAARRNPPSFVVSGDFRRVKSKHQRKIVTQAGLTWFALSPGWTNIPVDVYAWKIVKVWPSIRETASEVTRPLIFQVPVSSLKVERLPAK